TSVKSQAIPRKSSNCLNSRFSLNRARVLTKNVHRPARHTRRASPSPRMFQVGSRGFIGFLTCFPCFQLVNGDPQVVVRGQEYGILSPILTDGRWTRAGIGFIPYFRFS